MFNADGSITETDGSGNTLQTVFSDNSTAITWSGTNGKMKKKTITFNADGSIDAAVVDLN